MSEPTSKQFSVFVLFNDAAAGYWWFECQFQSFLTRERHLVVISCEYKQTKKKDQHSVFEITFTPKADGLNNYNLLLSY